MVKSENKKIDNIEKLVETIAINVFKLTDKVDNIDKNVVGIKGEIKGVKNQLEGTNKRIDDMAVNRVKYEDHNKLKSRVDFIEEKLEI